MIIYEIPFQLTQEQKELLIHFFKEQYDNTDQEAHEFKDELHAVTLAIMKGIIPLETERLPEYKRELYKLIPGLQEKAEAEFGQGHPFIGWFAYNPNYGIRSDTLARMINDCLEGYSGPIYATAVWSSKYHDTGVVFTNRPVDEAYCQAYFEDCLDMLVEAEQQVFATTVEFTPDDPGYDEVEEMVESLIKNKTPVRLYHTNDTGYWEWAVIPLQDDLEIEVWLDSFNTKEEAIEFCKKHGLPIWEVRDDYTGDGQGKVS